MAVFGKHLQMSPCRFSLLGHVFDELVFNDSLFYTWGFYHHWLLPALGVVVSPHQLLVKSLTVPCSEWVHSPCPCPLQEQSEHGGADRSGGGRSRQVPVEGWLTKVGLSLNAYSAQPEVDTGILQAIILKKVI